jgi:hypothetical protein
MLSIFAISEIVTPVIVSIIGRLNGFLINVCYGGHLLNKCIGKFAKIIGICPIFQMFFLT